MALSVIEGAPRTRQGRLSGPSRPIDRRINAVRDDLADAALAGFVVAPRYAEGVDRCCVVPMAMLHAAPAGDAVAVSAVLFGEVFTVFDAAAGWAWGQGHDDGYVGWLAISALGPVTSPASHRIAVPAATVFAAPDIKARVVARLPLNARVAAREANGAFVAAAGGFIHHRHLAPIDTTSGDPVAIALGFVGTPYVWGGRTRDGIDCSGLIQAALRATGVACPRDSDQQAATFAVIDPAERRRGDLVVFPGHVGILADAETLCHANAHWLTTLAEPLADVAARLAPSGFRRPLTPAPTPCSRP